MPEGGAIFLRTCYAMPGAEQRMVLPGNGSRSTEPVLWLPGSTPLPANARAMRCPVLTYWTVASQGS